MELPVSCKKLHSWFSLPNLVTPWMIELMEQHTRAATDVKVLVKMECTYWTYSINHPILYWGMTFLTIQLAMAWTNYT